MIFGIYVTVMMLMVLFFLIGVYGEFGSIQRLIANFFSMLFGIITLAGSVGIYIPFETTIAQEIGIGAVASGFIFINCAFIIVNFIAYRHEDEIYRMIP